MTSFSVQTAASSSNAFLRVSGLLRLVGLLVVLTLSALRAQTVRWEPNGGALASGKFEEVTLVFENCAPKSEPQIPKVPGLTLVQRGSSQNVSMVNFKMTKSVTYLYAARLEKKEKAVIPSFEVETDQGKVRVAAVTFEPGSTTVGQNGLSLEDVAESRLLPESATVWAGQVFPLTYRLEVLRRYFHNLGSVPDWNPAPLVVEEWTKPDSTESRKGADPVINIFHRTRAYAKEPGSVTLNSATQLVNIQTGVSGGFFFNQPQLEQIVVTSDQPKLVVKPLPSPAPASFAGAVGQFKLTSTIVPLSAKVGEPVTWTLELAGTGNWPDIAGLPEREVSKAFQVIQPKAKRAMTENKLFEGSITEDVVLMPTRAGTYTLGPVEFTYFDPVSGAYKTERGQSVTVTIAEAASEQSASPGTGRPQPAEGKGGSSGEVKVQTPPGPPAMIPTDPLEGPETAFVPLSRDAVVLLAALPFALLAGAWGFFSFQRALDVDPNRPRRAASKKLKTTLAALASESETGRMRPMLLAWQKEAGRMLGCDRAAPTAEYIEAMEKAGDKAAKKGKVPDYALWAALWREADEALYGAEAKLPSDWAQRALLAYEGTKVPAFPFYKVLAPGNLMPWWFAAALMLAAVALPGKTYAAAVQSGPTPAEGAAAYASGDFALAAKAWENEVIKHPTDWRARHNFGLALLQQGHHGAALAELAASFVQSSGNETVRGNLLVAAEHAGFAPQVVGDLALNNPGAELTRLTTPFGWQLLLACAALLAAVALGIALWRGYGLRVRWGKQIVLATLALALVLSGTALYGLHRYGPAADREAVLVWQSSTLRSIPTEVDSGQKTAALAAGSIAVVDRSFLGWQHLRFPEGQTGWVRSEDLVYLWR